MQCIHHPGFLLSFYYEQLASSFSSNPQLKSLESLDKILYQCRGRFVILQPAYTLSAECCHQLTRNDECVSAFSDSSRSLHFPYNDTQFNIDCNKTHLSGNWRCPPTEEHCLLCIHSSQLAAGTRGYVPCRHVSDISL